MMYTLSRAYIHLKGRGSGCGKLGVGGGALKVT